jgi:hypothetical protein
MSVSVVFLFALAPAVVAQQDFNTTKREVGSGVARHLAHAEQLEQSYLDEQYDELQQHKLISAVQHKLLRSGEHLLFEADVRTAPPPNLAGLRPRATSQVLARNSRYGFELDRANDGTAWRLKGLHQSTSAEPTPKQFTAEFLTAAVSQPRPYANGQSVLLTELFASPSFKLLRCAASPADSALVRVEFEFSQERPNKPASHTLSAQRSPRCERR